MKAQILAGGRGLGVFDSGFKGGVHLTKEYNQRNSLYLLILLIVCIIMLPAH